MSLATQDSRSTLHASQHNDYVSAPEDGSESAWEGNWKNPVDSLVMNVALAPVIFTVGSVLRSRVH